LVSILRRTFIKIYIVLWFITGCKVSYRPYEFDNNPEIIAPDYANEESWAVLLMVLVRVDIGIQHLNHMESGEMKKDFISEI